MTFAGWFINITELLIFFVGLYYAAVGVFSNFGRRRVPQTEKRGSFAVIVPAHNEAAVIGQLLSSIKRCDYPTELVSVFVVADSCSDGTADIAAMYGARVISKSGATCKAAALAEGRNAVLAYGGFDFITVLDADNTVDADYFAQMNRAVRHGCDAAQGRLIAKNPESGFVPLAYSAWQSLEERLGRLASHNIGINVKLSGTGYTMRSEIFERLDMPEGCLAEDLEFTAQLALMKAKTVYVYDAVCRDEKPVKLSDSLRQRTRWAQGIVSAQGKYGFRLLRHGRIFDWLSLYGDFSAIFSFVFYCLIGVLASIAVVYDRNFAICALWRSVSGYIALGMYIGLGAFNVLSALCREKDGRLIPKLAGLLMLFVTWIPVGAFGVLFSGKTNWYHTEHGSVEREK